MDFCVDASKLGRWMAADRGRAAGRAAVDKERENVRGAARVKVRRDSILNGERCGVVENTRLGWNEEQRRREKDRGE